MEEDGLLKTSLAIGEDVIHASKCNFAMELLVCIKLHRLSKLSEVYSIFSGRIVPCSSSP